MTEQAKFSLRDRNPDVLNCIASLSNDEVFTPPELANQMLDTLAEGWAESNNGADIWSDKSVTFLDPFTKTGVFLREITSRLIKGLEGEFPDLEQRVEHILKKQVFGIAITQLTSLLARRSLYCSKLANGEHSIVNTFDSPNGNIWFERIEHTWKGSRCQFCSTPKEILSRDEGIENYAYAFIHTNDIKTRLPELFGVNMQFDVIIGNPPYQLSDGGHGRSSSPIYHLFVEQAKKLDPRNIVMVIPARWYAGGKGLDDFRHQMLTERKIQKIVDFENSSKVFSGVDIAGGICYFLWNKEWNGDCEVINSEADNLDSNTRALDEFPIFIRQSQAVEIIKTVQIAHQDNGLYLSKKVSPRKPFGLPTTYVPSKSGTPCWYTQKIGKKFAKDSDIRDSNNLLNKWKLLIPPTPIAGQTDFSKPIGFYYPGNIRIAKPGECCTESWLVAFSSDTKKEVLSFQSYLFTKIVRFLLLQSVVSQHVLRDKFAFVPDLGAYKENYNDEVLRKMWGITEKQWHFIDSKIKPIEYSNE